ncbi:hypothetical protein D9757_007924 [Collybiopsis confluens]|uniref:Uncharacterized protein n=1 Tax=Collybiopsis confluens TaxID=2823264 RepID=A0A8H5HBV4_9AGAR|nr:hypothetical protein D9757_007924 [Collybiopsis confluens]
MIIQLQVQSSNSTHPPERFLAGQTKRPPPYTSTMYFSLIPLFLSGLISSVCAAPLSNSVESRSMAISKDTILQARNTRTIKFEVTYPSLEEGDPGRTSLTGFSDKTNEKVQRMITTVLQSASIHTDLEVPDNAKVEIEFKQNYPYKSFKERKVGYYELKGWQIPNQGDGKLIGTFGIGVTGRELGEIQLEKMVNGKKTTKSVAEYIP